MDLTSFYSACKGGDVKKLKRYCDTLKSDKKNADFHSKFDPNGLLPMDITVINDKLENCQYLCETFNLNPLNFNQSGFSSLFYAIDLGRLNFLKYFIDNSKKYYVGRTYEDLLIQASITNQNKCAFHVAIEGSHPQIENILQLLLSYIHLTIQLKKKLFIGAVRARNLFLIEYILNKDLSEEERRDFLNLNFNLSSDFMRKNNILSEAEVTPLIYSITRKDRQLISYLLSEPLIDVNLFNVPIKDLTPLFAAVTLNDIETVILLCEKKVNTLQTVKGITPLTQALLVRKEFVKNSDDKKAAKQNFMIIELLCSGANEAHAESNGDGGCSFDTAVILEYTDVIEHFISVYADLYERQNKIGRAPIDYAKVEYRKFLEQKFPRKA
jgi:ankyrin repeat protein